MCTYLMIQNVERDLYGEKSRMNVRSILISRKRTVSLIRVGIFRFLGFLISG